MGHLVHPTGYRLGKSVKWKSSWVVVSKSLYRKYLHSDLIIYKFLNIFFRKYALPYYTYIERRRTEKHFKDAKKISGLSSILANPFASRDFSFSHVEVHRQNVLSISCYLLDGELEQWRLAFQNKMRRSTHRSSSMFFPMKPIQKYQNDLILLSELEERSKMRTTGDKMTYFLRVILKNKWEDMQAYLLKMELSRRKGRRRKVSGDNLKKLRGLMDCLALHPLYSFQKDHKVSWNAPFFLIGENYFKHLKSYLVSFSNVVTKNKKNQFFFFTGLKGMLGKSISLFNGIKKVQRVGVFKRGVKVKGKRRVKVKRIKVKGKRRVKVKVKVKRGVSIPLCVLRMYNFLRIKEHDFGHLKPYYHEEFFKTRKFLYQYASVAIAYSLDAFDKTNKVKISFFGMHMRNISASHVVCYILYKLRNFFTIHNIIPPLITEFRRNSDLFAYRIVVSGRLTRKERAWYKIYQTQYMGFGKKTLPIDYAMDHVALRFGTVGVKVSLVYNRFRPFLYSITFIYKKNL